MQSSKDLLLLIKSLTKAEKIHFTRFSPTHVAASENFYIRLFRELEKIKDDNLYNEAKIKKKFSDEGIIKNFEFTKNYLFKSILKSLNILYYDSTPGSEIKNNIRYIEILYKKGLYPICVKILNKSLKLADSTSNFFATLELLRWKKNLIFEGIYGADEFTELENSYKYEQEIINKVKNLSDYRVLSYHTLSIINGIKPSLKNEEAIRGLRRILKHRLLQSEQRALSQQAIFYYYQILAFIHSNLGNEPEAYKNWERIIKTMEDSPDSLHANFTNYIVTVINLLGSCVRLKLNNELDYYINKLKSLNEVKHNLVFENDRILIFSAISIYELRRSIGKGEFVSQHKKMNYIENGLNKFNKVLLKDDKFLIFYLLGYVCFGAGKMDETLKWLNKIINDKEIIHLNKLYVKSKTLNLITHYEVGDYDLLEYLIKAQERFLRKSSFDFQNDVLVIELLRTLLAATNQSQKSAILKRALSGSSAGKTNKIRKKSLQNKIKPFEVRGGFQRPDEFDLESWLESKISGRSFEEIVKAKR